MFKKITQILVLISAIITATFAAIFWTQQPGWDPFLDASHYVESKESKEFRSQNKLPQYINRKYNIENSFLATNLDNYALYSYDGSIYKQGHHDINQLDFYGNLDSYNNVKNDAMSVDLWNNDFAVVNLVIKTQKNFESEDDKLSISFENNDKELKISSGYLRFIVADNDETTPGWSLSGGVTKSLLVPDAITSKQDENMIANKVYIYRIRLDYKSNEPINDVLSTPVYVDIKNRNSIIDKKLIDVRKQPYDLKQKSVDESQEPSYEILNYPTFMAYYYNNKSIDYNNLTYYNHQSQRERNEEGSIPSLASSASDFNKFDMVQYIDWNWEHYWEPEFKYHHDYLNDEEFIINFSHDMNHARSYYMDDEKNIDAILKGNLWNEDRDGNSWWIPRIIDGKVRLLDSDWEAFDDYVYKMGALGYKNMVFNYQKMSWYTSLFYVWNEKENKWSQQEISVDFTHNIHKIPGSGDSRKVSGFDLNKSFIEAYLDHVKKLKNSSDYKYNWVKEYSDITAQFYVDEPNGEDVQAINKIVNDVKDENAGYNQYLKTDVAFPIWNMRTDLKWAEEVKDSDVLYTNTFSIYNDDNPAIKDLIEYRNKHGLVTGIYQLSGSANFDMLRANPAVLIYEMMLLNKQNEPHYMKYMMARWDDKRFQQDSYYYGTYWEKEFFNFPDVSGNVSWEYPSISYDEMFENDEWYTKPIEINPSVRLESLAEGLNLVKKINVLFSLNKLNKNEVNNSIAKILTGSSHQSYNAFTFDSDHLELEIEEPKSSISYIAMSQEQRNYKFGQTDSVKWIMKLIEKAEEIK